MAGSAAAPTTSAPTADARPGAAATAGHRRLRPTAAAAQRKFVKTRDRTCRYPNCGQRVGWAALDHVVPHAGGGKIEYANLCCPFRSHNRLKTQDQHCRFVMTDDGVLSVTTPSGITRTTRPPGLRAPRPHEPPASTELAPSPADQDDDASPFWIAGVCRPHSPSFGRWAPAARRPRRLSRRVPEGSFGDTGA